MLGQHFRDQLADASETDDDCAGAGAANIFIKLMSSALHFNASGNIASYSSKQWGYQQAKGRCNLPEFGCLGIDNLRCQRRSEHNQRQFGWAGHQQSGFRRNPGACANEAQQAGRDYNLDQHYPSEGCCQLRPIIGNEVEVDLHPDADQENTKGQTLEGQDDGFNLSTIIGFGNEQACNQRADDRRQAHCPGSQAGNDHDQQADRNK